MSDPYAPPPQPGQPYYPQQPPQDPSPYGAQQPYQDPSQPAPYAAQPYGDPYAGQQQAYPQPGYGQQFPGYPLQPPVKKRRTGLIIGVVAAVVALVACSGITIAAVKFGSDHKGSSLGGTSTKPVSLTAPGTIGTLKKSSDQSQAERLNGAMTSAGLEHPFAAAYQDTKNSGHRVVIWGGTGSIFSAGSPEQELDSFFTSVGNQLGDAKPATVDAGAVGGKAECAKSGASGMRLSICAWVGSDALLGFIFNNVEPDAAGTQMRTILPSIVVKG